LLRGLLRAQWQLARVAAPVRHRGPGLNPPPAVLSRISSSRISSSRIGSSRRPVSPVPVFRRWLGGGRAGRGVGGATIVAQGALPSAGGTPARAQPGKDAVADRSAYPDGVVVALRAAVARRQDAEEDEREEHEAEYEQSAEDEYE